jgi:hypothetical protein
LTLLPFSLEENGHYELIFSLCYHRGDALHGSGLSFTRSDVRDMTIGEATYHLERLRECRGKEAAALRQPSSRSRRRR